ncbi:tartrate dehydrogenase [Marinithermus hydrothermalis]|uniref:Tartrate dehydrogenase n=1 Tax=Marinithermus hydrothermalis (strain DSM 14884 / JCM 11576 / T1) TaxID=869210 RepID=F2NQG3_MARHT|nr:tartrate dehydrogenase [Marinithermus hydrothermalis]AEB11690.1 tartrate dehydrogenase [Marinithermus hydrothermalis DSM 14884]
MPYSIGLIPGDGIGTEVIPEGVRVLEALAAWFGFDLQITDYPYSCAYYLEHGTMMPEAAFEALKQHDAILLGAVGDPRRVPDHVSLRGLLVPLRQRFDLYINLRPARPLPGLPTPLKGNPAFDIVFVRENSEGEYAGAGGRLRQGTPDEVALQTTVFTRKGVERAVRYAFDLAIKRQKRLANATKSNAMQYAFVMWDEVVAEVAREYPDVEVTRYHADALAAMLVRDPTRLDVVVASNLIGDLLTDLAGALQGSLGLPASANLNPERTYPSLFEPVHGSAPDIAGQGIANPIATYWAVGLMLEFLGEAAAARALMQAVEAVTAEGRVLTPDLGGTARTGEVTRAVLEKLEEVEA